MAEKRQAPRWSHRLRVHVWQPGDDKPLVGYTENVSPSGMFLSTPRPLNPGARIRIEVVGDERSFMVEGVVTHTRRVPRELQRVKQAGMGVALLPFDVFLREVRPSGMALTPSGEFRMTKDQAPTSPLAGSAADTTQRKKPAASPSSVTTAGKGGRPSRSGTIITPRKVVESRPPRRRSNVPFAREAPHERKSSKSVVEPVTVPTEDDHALLYPVEFASASEFLRSFDTDIRMGIFMVSTRAPAPAGARVTLQVKPFGAKKQLRFDAEVVRDAPGEGGMAGMLVRFIEPSMVIDSLGLIARELRSRS